MHPETKQMQCEVNVEMGGVGLGWYTVAWLHVYKAIVWETNHVGTHFFYNLRHCSRLLVSIA